jgi:hypothetical protein
LTTISLALNDSIVLVIVQQALILRGANVQRHHLALDCPGAANRARHTLAEGVADEAAGPYLGYEFSVGPEM